MSPGIVPELSFTAHARTRMDSRRISAKGVEMVIAYGRAVQVRGAQIYALGKKEVLLAAREGIDLSCFAGLQVVCSPTGAVLTTYRNHDFRPLRRSA